MTTSRPRLLFLCQTLPFPPDGGVSIRTFNVMRLLSRHFDITALCFYRVLDRATPEAVARSIAGLQPYARVEAFPIPQEHSRLRLLMDHAASVLTRRAYTVFAYRSAAFHARLRALKSEHPFALVHMDSMDLSDYLPDVADLSVVCVHHNVESALLRRRAAASSWPASAYVAMQAELTEQEERDFCPAVALNVAVSPSDAIDLERLAPNGRYTVVPNGVDTETFRPRPEGADAAGIVFVGGYGWQPNRDAMDFFCESVLPRIRARGLSPAVTWVGRASPEVVANYQSRYGVTLTGYVDDIRPIVLGAACYIAPLRAGGGTRLKILDAWAMGMAVVSTAVGCEGLEAVDGQNILIRDDPDAFAQAVVELLSDPVRRLSMGQHARQTAETTYDWEVIGQSMIATYVTVLGPVRTPDEKAQLDTP